MDERETLITRVMDAGGRLRVRSALNPVLWLCAIVTVPTIVSLGFMEPKPGWLIAIAVAPVAVALLGFLFLLFFDRDKLQSEEYQIRKQSLEMIQEKGGAKIPFDDVSAVLIENPQVENPEPPLIDESKEAEE